MLASSTKEFNAQSFLKAILILISVSIYNVKLVRAEESHIKKCEIGANVLDAVHNLSSAPIASVKPATAILPTKTTSRLIFRQPTSQVAKSTTYRVFEVNDSRGAAQNLDEVLVLSAQADTDAETAGARDSIILTIQVQPDDDWGWPRHEFFVVGCTGAKIDSWARIAARVSNPKLSLAVCAGLTAVMYGLAMAAVWASSRSKHVLGSKYPAIYERYQLKPLDFFNPIHLVVDPFNHASVQKF